MAQMNYPHAPDGCQPGERVIFNALKRYLPDDYYIWFEPTLFGKKRSARPDFMVLGSDIGLVLIEVKDWSLDCIHSANRDNFEIFKGQAKVIRTFHSVKGLEFEVVFICGLEALTVAESSQVDDREFQELLDQERKLLYVGMTRARRLLYITYSGVAPDWIAGRLEQKLQALLPK